MLVVRAIVELCHAPAAVARAMLLKVAAVVDDRRRVAAVLMEAVSRPGVEVSDPSRHSFWVCPLVLDLAVFGGSNQRLATLLEGRGGPVRGFPGVTTGNVRVQKYG